MVWENVRVWYIFCTREFENISYEKFGEVKTKKLDISTNL